MDEIQKIPNNYKKLKHMPLQRLGVCFLIIAACVLVFSLGFGNPFGVEGWLTEKVYLFVIICIFSMIVAFVWEFQRIQKCFQPLANILFQECEAKKLYEISQQGIAYGVNNPQDAKSAAFLQYEALYITSLIAMGEAETAMNYLTNEWHSIKRKTYGQAVNQLQLNMAAEKKNKEEYIALYQQSSAIIKNNVIYQTQRAIVEEDYARALEIMKNNFKVTNPLQKLQQHYFLGKCYHLLGERETAGMHFAYVTANGKDLMYRTKALELTAENK